MNKVILTQEQVDTIEQLLKGHEGNKDEIMDIHCNEDFEWEEEYTPIEELKPSQMARALYVGYEVAPKFVSFDKAVKALEEGKAVYFHDGEWETKIIYGEYLGDGELSGYTMTQLIKGRWSIGRER